jgi:Transglycosylase SLT domain
VRKRSSLAAFVLALLCVPPALAAEDGESLVASVCRIIDSSALSQHLPVAFLTGLIWQESNFRPDAVSPVGARGIAQFMPAVAAERGLANPNDPEAAIPKAAELLANLKQRFGNLGLAAAAYNAGATRVASWLAGMGELPLETRDYVMTVTRHPVEEWSGLGAAKLTDDAVFPDSSCVQHIAAVSRREPAVLANSAWASWGLQISGGFSKGAAMWNEYASALNNYLLSLPIQKFYSTYVSSQLRPDVLVCVALMIFVLVYIRRPLNNIRDEMRRNKIHLEAILRSDAMDLTKPMLSKPVPADDGSGFLHAERAERLLERAEPRPSWRLLARLDLKRHAAAEKIFGALGRNGVATPQGEETTVDPPAPPESHAVAGDQNVAGDSSAEEKPAAWPPEVIPFADAAFRRPRPQAEKAKARRLKPIAIGSGLALVAACGAFAIYGSPLNSAFAAAKSQAIAGLAAVADVLKTPLDAITGSSSREEERAAMRNLSAAVAQMTVRLDQIEHDYGARLDKLSDRIDQDSAPRFADIAARLDKLEQKAAAPAAPSAQFADIATRLDKLEKVAALGALPAAQLADIAARLDKLEKKAVPGAPSSEAAESGPRLDKPERKAAGAAASSAAPLPPATPKQSMLMAKAEPSAANERARSDNPDNPRPLLRNYSVDYVQGGIAVVDGRYGSQQVAPGDMIPGAGRVLRIERRGGNWVVVTSLGVISSGPAPR